MTTITLKNSKTGQDIEFETRWFSRLRQYRLPGEKFWTHSPHFPTTEGAYPEPRALFTILQDLLGGAINPLERNLLVETYIDRGLSEEEREVLRQTCSLEKIDQIERRVKLLVNGEVKAVADGETEKANTEALKKFTAQLPNTYIKLTCPNGHKIVKHGGMMIMFEKQLRSHPDMKFFKCQVCGEKIPVEQLKPFLLA